MRKLSVLAVIVALALLGVAVWLAEGFRLRVLQVVGIGFVAVGLILMVTRRLVGNAVVDALADSPPATPHRPCGSSGPIC